MKADSQKKLIYVISNIEKSLAFEWQAAYLKQHYNLTFVLLNPVGSFLEEYLKAKGVNCIRITYRGKKDFLTAFIKLFISFITQRPQIVHAHLFDAQLIALTAAWMARVKKRIYTRHNSNFHQMYFPKAVKYDRWCNRISTCVVSISQATDFTLIDLEGLPPEKVVKIPHGFKISEFKQVSSDRIVYLRKKWQVPEAKIIVGVIARQIEWKGIQYIIPAFKKFHQKHPDAFLIMANSTGPYHQQIEEMLKELPVNSYLCIPFENDAAALYHLFNFYVHAPVDQICEAFGQTYVEALAAGIPSIFTPSGIAAEFIIHKKNAYLAKFKDSESIYTGLSDLLENKFALQAMISKGRQDVSEMFNITRMCERLRMFYDNESAIF